MERNDRGGWIDFCTQKPEMGQEIEVQGSDYVITMGRKPLTGVYIGASSLGRGKIKNVEHRYISFFHKWRPKNNNREEIKQ